MSEDEDLMTSTLLAGLLLLTSTAESPQTAKTGKTAKAKPFGKAAPKPFGKAAPKGKVVRGKPVTPRKDRERSRSRGSSDGDDSPKDKKQNRSTVFLQLLFRCFTYFRFFAFLCPFLF